MLGFFSSKSKQSCVGVDFLATGVAVVEVAAGKSMPGKVKTCDFLPAVGHVEQAQALQDWVEGHHLKNTSCVSLIARQDVQVLQLEKPTVEDSELVQAVSWKIADLINYEIDAAVVDVFQLPPSPKSPVHYINAVVANEAVVSRYVDSIRQSGLALTTIDIHELVTKNYCRICDVADATVAVLHLSDKAGQVTIYHNQDLYVARDFKIGLLQIEAALAEDETTYDSLLLELQRSMDYFESTYGLGMVQQMLVFPETPGTIRMTNYVQNYVGFELGFVDVSMHKDDLAEQIDAHCFSAYCAALRGISP